MEMRRRHQLAMGDKRTHGAHRQLLGIALLCVSIWPLTAHAALDTWTGLGLTDDWSDPANWLDGSPPLFTDSVLFNASDSGHTSIIDAAFFALNPTGELLALQYTGNAIHTTDFAGAGNLKINGPVYVGYGGATDGASVTWTETGSIQIGDPLSLTTFHIGTNTSSSTVSNTGSLLLDGPAVSAHVSDLSIGRKANTSGYGTANGSMVLGDNSTLHVGTVATPGVVNVGMNQSSAYSPYYGVLAGGDGTGLLDATRGEVDFHLSELNVGRHRGRYGTTTGTFTMGDGSVVTATTANVGTTSGGTAAGTLNLAGGLLAADTINVGVGGDFNFTGGRLAVNHFRPVGDNDLLQEAGTLAPGFSRTVRSLPGITECEANYIIQTAGVLEIELFGTVAGTGYDQVRVFGEVDLDGDGLGGGTLDLILKFAPSVGDAFVIVQNDGSDPIAGHFWGLPEAAKFTEWYMGSEYAFWIS
jgi:hypothetical protein